MTNNLKYTNKEGYILLVATSDEITVEMYIYSISKSLVIRYSLYDKDALNKAKYTFESLKRILEDISEGGDVYNISPDIDENEVKKFIDELGVFNDKGEQIKPFPNVLVFGPTGSGKTYSIMQYLTALNFDGFLDDVMEIGFYSGMEDTDLLVKFFPKDGKIVSEDGDLVKLFKKAEKGKVGVILDEINRASPKALNILLRALDRYRGNYYVLENYITGEKYQVPVENIVLFATANLGGGYSGTAVLDEALKDRFQSVIFKGYSIELVEKKIEEEGFESLKYELLTVFNTINENYKMGMLPSPMSIRTMSNWLEYTQKVDDIDEQKTIFYLTARDLWMYRLVSVDNYGMPDENEVEIIKNILKDAGFEPPY